MKWWATVTALLLYQSAHAAPDDIHVWEKTELTFRARNNYSNAYSQVEIWVDLRRNWSTAGSLKADVWGRIELPNFPSDADWGLKLRRFR